MTDPDHDAIREALRRADPARSLAPLARDRLERLTEDAMTEQPTPQPTRSRRLAVGIASGLAALGATAIAAIVAVPLLTGPGDPTVLAQPEGGGGATSMCMRIEAEQIAQADVAFRGEVTAVEGDTVTLRVLESFAGDVNATVQIPQGDVMDGDFSGVEFAVGESYLVAAYDGVLGLCGASGPESPELAALYAEAFDR